MSNIFDLDTYLTNETDFIPEGAETNSEYVESLFADAGDSEFIDSLYEWWEEKGFLTEAQVAKLKEIVDEYEEEAPSSWDDYR